MQTPISKAVVYFAYGIKAAFEGVAGGIRVAWTTLFYWLSSAWAEIMDWIPFVSDQAVAKLRQHAKDAAAEADKVSGGVADNLKSIVDERNAALSGLDERDKGLRSEREQTLYDDINRRQKQVEKARK